MSKIHTQLDVTGTLKAKDESGAEKPLKLAVSATMEYDEHRLSTSGSGRRAIRQYHQAEATIRIDQGQHRPSLPTKGRLMAVYVTAEKAHLFSPSGSITRDELDLVDIPGNSAVLPLLLPGKSVEVGAKWTVPGDTMAMFLCLESASASDVQCTLQQVSSARVARISIAGHVDGAAAGAATEISVSGDFDYDLNARRVSRLELEFKENRAMGHIGPALNATCRLHLTAEALKTSTTLTDDRTIAAVREPDATALALTCDSPAGGYALLHSRAWHVVDQRQGMAALRMIDRGDLLAQCNVSPVKLEPGQTAVQSLAAYRQQVEKTLDKRFRKLVSATEHTTQSDLKVFAVVTEGEHDQVPVRWMHYLLTHSSGKQVGVVFTLDPKQVDSFGIAAESLINRIRIAAPTTAQSPAAGASKAADRRPRVAR